MQRFCFFLWFNSFLFGLFSGYFQHTNCSVLPPSNRLPVIRVILSHLKVAYFQNKLAFSTRYTNKITVLYQYAFPGNTELHFIITNILSSNFTHTKLALSCFNISDSKWFAGPSESLLWFRMALLWCFAVLPPAPEVLAEIKTTIFDNAFCPLIL